MGAGLFPLLGSGPYTSELAFSFEAQNGAQPQVKIRDGKGGKVLSVTRGAAGVYTVALDKAYPLQIIPCGAGVSASGAMRNGQVEVDEASYSASAGTFTIRHALTGAPTTPADPANGDRVWVNLVYIWKGAVNA